MRPLRLSDKNGCFAAPTTGRGRDIVKILQEQRESNGVKGVLRTVLLAAIATLIPGLAMAEADPAHGLWLTENGKAIVEFAPCGNKVCGKMVWIANPNDDLGNPKLDLKNDEPGLRGRTLCGLQLLGDLSPEDPGAWNDGWIYSPRDGSTYSAKIEAISDSELEVRGYVGLSILGGSQIWTRVADNRGGCPK